MKFFIFRFDLKRKKDRLSFALLLILISMFAAISFSGSLNFTSYPVFCSLCHEMKPEYQTWAASSHSSISCNACHMDKGANGLINYEKTLASRFQKHFKGDYYRPIELKKQVTPERCLSCHNITRKVSAHGDILIPHEKHLRRKISCLECHSGVAHGKIADRGLTEDKDYSFWTPAMAKDEMTRINTGLAMQECLDCHESMEVKATCEDCHGAIKKPPSHFTTRFQRTHGKEARKDIKYCNMCHSYSKSFISVDAVDTTAEYARENNFCFNCHMKKPPGHGPDWRNLHGKSIGSMANRNGCLACHDENRLSKAFRSTESDCNKCHYEKHNPNWLSNHQGRIKKGSFNPECLSCHPSTKCGSCHYVFNNQKE